MRPEPKRWCDSCRHWDEQTEMSGGRDSWGDFRFGECHRYPPNVPSDDPPKWPTTSAVDTCGEWTAALAAKETENG